MEFLDIPSLELIARMIKLMLAAATPSNSLLEVLLCFCLVFLALLGFVTLCRYFMNCLTSAFEAYCDWLDCWLAGRKKRRHDTELRAVPPVQSSRSVSEDKSSTHTVPTVSRKRSLGANRHLRVVSAEDALRRNAESSHSLARAE